MDPTNISRVLLQVLFTMKMYHWHTTSYSRHKATDFFYGEAHKLIDRFVEVMMSRYGRVIAGSAPVTHKPLIAVTDANASRFLEDFADFLIRNVPMDPTADVDLISIRDDLLGVTRQTLYLFTLQ